MATDDETATRDGEPTVTGYRLSPSLARPANQPRYRRGAEIARGGFGRITGAFDEQLQREVAIKELHARTEQGRQRFELESLTTARLQHPAIVGVFDSGTWDSGDPYIVMQLLEGVTLAEAIAARPTLDARLALIPNLLAIADALAYAHDQGVVHRDVKPSNVMLGEHGETVIVDWGVAFDATRSTNLRDELVGTPRFMSPEQARGEAPVPAFDVFSLGMTIATLLSGTQPFATVAGDDIVTQLRAGTRNVPALPAAAPRDLVSVVDKATGPAEGRYANAGELATDLRRFIAGQLVGARRYAKRELVVRWLRRHRVVVAAAVIVLVVAVLAVVSVIRERNAAVARSRELLLLEARSRVRTDPTATIAWLKEDAGDHVALVDEAAGRMVARHVWYPAQLVDAVLDDDGALIVATRDGAITRVDPRTGARMQLAMLPVMPLAIAARAPQLAAIDADGTVWRLPAERIGRVTVAEPVTALAIAPDGSLKVSFIDGTTVRVGDTVELHAGDHELTKVWQLSPRTWVRSSSDGSHYLAIAPEAGEHSIWIGTLTSPPVELARARACIEDGSQLADVTNDGRFALVRRCGVLTVYDAIRRQPIAVPESGRVNAPVFSPDSKWLALGHGQGLDLIELATGRARRIDPGLAVKSIGFSRDQRSMFATGVEGSVRVWTLPDDASAARLGDRPGRVELVRAGNDLVVQRPLECASWDPRARRIHSLARLPAASAREGDDELRRWPRAVSGDGKTCLFDGRDATTIVVGAGEHVIRQPVEQCVLSTDGSVATCVWKDSMFALELAGARVLASRSVPVIASLDTFRGTPVVLTAACTVEELGGRVIAKLSAGPACELMRVDGDHIVIARGNRTAVWTAGVELELTAQLVDVYPVGEWVAVVHANDVDIVDARTEQPVAKPPRHELAIRRAAWSSTQLLATSDDETIQLWDPATRRARVIVAGQLASIAWSRDGKTLYATDGQVMYAWPIDMAAPTPNLDALTTARIVDGRAETP